MYLTLPAEITQTYFFIILYRNKNGSINPFFV
jgi:hypothetical protein